MNSLGTIWEVPRLIIIPGNHAGEYLEAQMFTLMQYCYGWAVYHAESNTFPSGICHSKESAEACLKYLEAQS